MLLLEDVAMYWQGISQFFWGQTGGLRLNMSLDKSKGYESSMGTLKTSCQTPTKFTGCDINLFQEWQRQ